MNENVSIADSQRLVKLVGYFATPFALMVGGLGVIVSGATDTVRAVCVGLLGFSGFLNLIFPKFLEGQSADKKGPNVRVRMALNVLVNALLVYFLGVDFSSIWLILALSPFATAIYGSRRKTAVAAATSVAILLTVHVLRGDHRFVVWAETLARVGFIVLISLMINGVANLVSRPEKIL